MNTKENRARTARETATLLRRCLTAASALCVVGTAIELAMYRHWDSTEQLIPWVALAILAGAIVMFALRPTARVIRVIRPLLGLVALTALFGVYEHVHENFIAGPLDFRYSDKWDQMSTMSQWWHAFTKTVGPAPSLAPGVLFQAALLLFAATLRHPARHETTGNPAELAESVAVDLRDVIRTATRNGHATTVNPDLLNGHASRETTSDGAEAPADAYAGPRTVVDVLTHTVLDLQSRVTSPEHENGANGDGHV